jgi:hypothetical protein
MVYQSQYRKHWAGSAGRRRAVLGTSRYRNCTVIGHVTKSCDFNAGCLRSRLLTIRVTENAFSSIAFCPTLPVRSRISLWNNLEQLLYPTLFFEQRRSPQSFPFCPSASVSHTARASHFRFTACPLDLACASVGPKISDQVKALQT